MGIGSWGGGIVLGLVAVLWLVYLIPSWHKRQEYLATERNAVRLQQTLRIMAETAEVPEQVQIEANARSVASAQRILRDESVKREALRRAKEAARQRAVTRELAATGPALRAADSEPALAARRLRRTRLVATIVLALGLVGFVFGLTRLAAAWPVVVASLVAGAGSVIVLSQLAAVSRARARRLPVTAGAATDLTEAQPFQDFAPQVAEATQLTAAQDPAASPVAQREWTPVPIPRPLYLRRGSARALARSTASAASPVSEGDAQAMRAAAELSAAALRITQLEAQREAQQEALRSAARAEAALSGVAEVPVRAVRPVAAPVADGAAAGAPAAAGDGAAVASAAAAVPAAPAAPPSRFARMGFLDDDETQDLQLDEVLRRRRAV